MYEKVRDFGSDESNLTLVGFFIYVTSVLHLVMTQKIEKGMIAAVTVIATFLTAVAACQILKNHRHGIRTRFLMIYFFALIAAFVPFLFSAKTGTALLLIGIINSALVVIFLFVSLITTVLFKVLLDYKKWKINIKRYLVGVSIIFGIAIGAIAVSLISRLFLYTIETGLNNLSG